MKKHLAILLIICAAAIPAQTQDFDSSLTFITFNIRLGNDWSRQYDGPNHWDHRKTAVVRMIRSELPDAIGMQEVLPNQLRYLDSILSEYQRIGVGREDGHEKGECMAVFFKKSRFELVKSATYWLSETPSRVGKGWDAACHRTVTMVLLKDRMTDKELLYMNTHLDHMGRMARSESMKLLTRLTNEWVSQDVPIIIGGDMNTTSNDTIFNSLISYGFKNARQTAISTDNEATYTGFGKAVASQIDHFFVRGIAIKQFRTIKSDYGVPYISDHYPVSINFQFPSN